MFGIKSRRRLLRENEVMRQALSWYAAQETWKRKAIHPKGAPRKKWRKSPAATDRGHIAIRALTRIEESHSGAWSVTVPDPLPFPVAKPTSSTLGDAESLTTE